MRVARGEAAAAAPPTAVSGRESCASSHESVTAGMRAPRVSSTTPPVTSAALAADSASGKSMPVAR